MKSYLSVKMVVARLNGSISVNTVYKLVGRGTRLLSSGIEDETRRMIGEIRPGTRDEEGVHHDS
jgi:hypothetical protein